MARSILSYRSNTVSKSSKQGNARRLTLHAAIAQTVEKLNDNDDAKKAAAKARKNEAARNKRAALKLAA
jgi:hypothetical protein